VILRRVIEHVKFQNWTAVALDFVIVVVGVFIGIQVSNWNDVRGERAMERLYLERLLADAQANERELECHLDRHRRLAGIFENFNASLVDNAAVENEEDLFRAMCRWFIQPVPNLQEATYDELVAAGGLSILKDHEIRRLIAEEKAAHEESARLDITIPALQRAVAPLDGYREWYISKENLSREGGVTARDRPFSRTDCRFDIDAMRADPRMPSIVAQLYRNETNYWGFRLIELEAVRAVKTRLETLLHLPPGGPPKASAP